MSDHLRRPSLTLGASGLMLRGGPQLTRRVLDAAASNRFTRLDVAAVWGPLYGLAVGNLPVVVRIPADSHWHVGNSPPPPFEVAYPSGVVDRTLADVKAAGLDIDIALFHKWDPTWGGEQLAELLTDLTKRCAHSGVRFGVSCPDSHPNAALSVASSITTVSLQYNVANQRAAAFGGTYADSGCSVSVRAPLDTGSLLPGFLDRLSNGDVRRRVFTPFADAVNRCAAVVAQIANECGESSVGVAIRWILRQPWVDEICVGATSVEQIEEIAAAWYSGPLPVWANQLLNSADWSWRYQ